MFCKAAKTHRAIMRNNNSLAVEPRQRNHFVGGASPNDKQRRKERDQPCE
jgi:hypothetical protein